MGHAHVERNACKDLFENENKHEEQKAFLFVYTNEYSHIYELYHLISCLFLLG